MSAQCGNPSVRRTWRAAFGPNGCERILALDAILVEVVRAVRAEHDRAVLAERTSRKPMPG